MHVFPQVSFSGLFSPMSRTSFVKERIRIYKQFSIFWNIFLNMGDLFPFYPLWLEGEIYIQFKEKGVNWKTHERSKSDWFWTFVNAHQVKHKHQKNTIVLTLWAVQIFKITYHWPTQNNVRGPINAP